MTRSYDDELPGRGYPSRTDPHTGDHEISLGTPTILGIFFALVLVCAGFFGFGYTLGRRSAPSVPVTIPGDSLAAASGAAKPSASLATPTPTPEPPAAQTAVVSLTPPSTATPTPQTTPAAVAPAPAISSQQATSNAQPTGSFVVQVAAVSSQDVADILTSSLQKKGYTVAVRHEAQDKLLHVQIGPFADKKDAQAMQARVLADGFNAIVK